jgi:hypothetical protein
MSAKYGGELQRYTRATRSPSAAHAPGFGVKKREVHFATLNASLNRQRQMSTTPEGSMMHGQ